MTFPVKHFGESAHSEELIKEFLGTSRELAAGSWPGGSSARWLGRSSGQLHGPVGSPLQDEVLILFPGSGNASRGQGPPERERERELHTGGAGPGLQSVPRRPARCSAAHIKTQRRARNPPVDLQSSVTPALSTKAGRGEGLQRSSPANSSGTRPNQRGGLGLKRPEQSGCL